MSFVIPQYSKSQINKAGEILADSPNHSLDEFIWATKVLANWRACHGYPINTFQATLRQKLKSIDPSAMVAQRLKRTPSIVFKLQRFKGMQLARMQDIGGLRAIVSSMAKLKALDRAYRSARFQHELSSSKNYLECPKEDGYRGIHLIYKYNNPSAPEYNGLSVELQLRTRLEHAWATAVETMGTFLGQALKSGQGEKDWRRFFAVASAVLAAEEKTKPVPGFEKYNIERLCTELASLERKLKVLDKLKGFAIAADRIHTKRGQGAYHLVILNSLDRSVQIIPYPMAKLDEATKDYAEVEQKAASGEQVEAVLVSAGPIDALRKAYPNYFLDTQVFVKKVEHYIDQAGGRKKYPKKKN